MGYLIKFISIFVCLALGFYIYKTDSGLFVLVLFFLINIVFATLSFFIIDTYKIYIPQAGYVLSLLIYIPVIQTNKKYKERITWNKSGKIDKAVVLLIFVMTVISAVSLYLWAVFIKKDLSMFRIYIPKAHYLVLIAYALFFPLYNAVIEEFISRAVLYDGFFNLSGNIPVTIISQAMVFSLWHFFGFPGGVVGVVMVFIWSLFLGFIRYKSKGMLAPLAAHFFADLSIVIILYFLIM